MSVTIKKERIRLEPGKLYIAPLATLTSAYAPIPASGLFVEGTGAITSVPGSVTWLPLGATADGSEFKASWEVAEVEVAESYYPTQYVTTKCASSLSCNLAQINMTNWMVAFNAPTSAWSGTPDATTGVGTFTPPLAGQEVRRQLLWISQGLTELLLLYAVLQGGEISIARKKGADKATLNCDFKCELPDTAVATVPWMYKVAGASNAVTVSGE